MAPSLAQLGPDWWIVDSSELRNLMNSSVGKMWEQRHSVAPSLHSNQSRSLHWQEFQKRLGNMMFHATFFLHLSANRAAISRRQQANVQALRNALTHRVIHMLNKPRHVQITFSHSIVLTMEQQIACNHMVENTQTNSNYLAGSMSSADCLPPVLRQHHLHQHVSSKACFFWVSLESSRINYSRLFMLNSICRTTFTWALRQFHQNNHRRVTRFSKMLECSLLKATLTLSCGLILG